jgi:hypothetical protein
MKPKLSGVNGLEYGLGRKSGCGKKATLRRQSGFGIKLENILANPIKVFNISTLTRPMICGSLHERFLAALWRDISGPFSNRTDKAY